ncbi:MAG: TonB-dependent receptor [Campylobacterota bacterium]|nr:TonB-dependent receptor [Campylobacterota bacterium]
MKIVNMKNIILSSILLSSSLHAKEDIFEESLEDILSMESEIKADIGSRDGARNHLKSNAPIDVITSEQIEHSGLTSLIDVLRYFVAGFNAPETSISDGSDHVRAYTLRGMSPDQILVLVNGKRLHSSSLLHVNGTIGRGSSHADLDTIALKSIQRVEILRDGAAAQYGSDAISGVINIILKGMGRKNSISIHSGQRLKGDGTQLQADAFISIPLEYDGFVNITLDVKDQEQTQRAGKDNRVSPPRVTTHVGIPDSTSYKGVLYTEIPQDGDVNLYSQISLNYRKTDSNAFFRDTNDSNPIYKNGFLPIIKTNIFDYSTAFGIKGEFTDKTTWELSNVTGQHKIDYYVNNSMNYDLGAVSPTSFYNGSLKFFQNTTMLDFKKSDDIFKVAGGLEYRYENYSIKAGDEASHSGASGSQGFAGYTADNEVNAFRSSYALYFDSIYDFTDKFMFEVALRYEEYSDFGESTNGKMALAYDITPELMLRVSGSTALSLNQTILKHRLMSPMTITSLLKEHLEQSMKFLNLLELEV